ncbi:hypothetical protein CC80DRAFT_202735 [Byssothecium circinans]|uniref:Uncharacterized protein n=1 Tax=Byssothecium circinans TaxID=147558 RepID=A0A6A5TG09_9PLEO|nr:hypothetical protein CC80DRAFT_202735 [Byssothecium circinans]
MGVSEQMQNATYRLIAYLLAIPSLIFYTPSLTGCVSNSPGIPNIFALRLRTIPNTASQVPEIRVGYFGMCFLLPTGTICQSTSGGDTNKILESIRGAMIMSNTTTSDDLESTISVALVLQSKILFCFLAGAGILFAIGLLFIALLKLHFRKAATYDAQIAKRRNLLRQASFTTVWLSVAFALASATSIN